MKKKLVVCLANVSTQWHLVLKCVMQCLIYHTGFVERIADNKTDYLHLVI